MPRSRGSGAIKRGSRLVTTSAGRVMAPSARTRSSSLTGSAVGAGAAAAGSAGADETEAETIGARARARESQFRRAARLADGIISISDTPEEYAQVVESVCSQAADLGRDPECLERVMYLTVNMDEDVPRAEAEAEKYLLGYYGANIWGTRWGPFGDPERVKDRISEYPDAGARTVIVRFASFEPERQLDRFLEIVAPTFQ